MADELLDLLQKGKTTESNSEGEAVVESEKKEVSENLNEEVSDSQENPETETLETETETETETEIETSDKDEVKDDAQASEVEEAKPFDKEEFLKSVGASEDDLKEFLANKNKVELSEEEKEAKAIEEEAEVDKIALQSGLKRSEINNLKLAEKAEAKDVVWENYKAEAKKRLGEDYHEDDALYDFESFYHINSDDESAVERGAKFLEVEKNNILEEKLEVLNNARRQYSEHKKLDVVSKKFDSIVSDSISSLGESISIKVGEESVEFNTSNFNKSALEKEMQDNPVLLSAFVDNQEGFSQFATEYVNAKVLKDNIESIYQRIWEVAQSKALKENAVGAEKPFTGNAEQGNKEVGISTGLGRTLDIIGR